MSRIGFNRKNFTLKGYFGIRARLALLALILVGPLMADRVRVLEDQRATQVGRLTEEFTKVAENTAAAQSQLMQSIEAVLRASSYIYASAQQSGQGCTILRASLRRDMPWITSLSVAGRDGGIVCSTLDDILTLNLADRPYFIQAVQAQGFVVSDFLISRRDNQPLVMAAFPVSSVQAGNDAMIVASVNLGWISRMMNNLGGRPGISAAMVDGVGIVMAAPAGQSELIGRPLDADALKAVMSIKASAQGRQSASVAFPAADGSRRAVSVAQVAGTAGGLVLTIDEAVLSAATSHEIRTAYLQLGLVCLFVLLGALVVAERIILRPITMITDTARRFGKGDWSARASDSRLPAEFAPLARAFNDMAAQLGARERDMLAANDRLTVMASIDPVTGLANRRGFQSRLDFEWAKAQQTDRDTAVALMMIDVDHFKLFNDTYGHLEGDACLNRLGAALAGIADQTGGFAGRYGGEEFCLLLPQADAAAAMQVGETVRSAVQALAIPHATGAYLRVTVSVGVACAMPHSGQQPNDLIEAADAALYAAKHRGRNGVVSHGLVRATDAPLALALAG